MYKKTPLLHNDVSTTEDMGFEPTHAFTRLPRFQHGLLSLLSNLPLFTNLVYHKAFFLANLFEVEESVIENERNCLTLENIGV